MRHEYSVCVANYQPIILEAVVRVLDRDPAAKLTGFGETPEDALQQRTVPDVVVLDCPREEQLMSVIRGLRKKIADIRVIVLTSSEDVGRAVCALEAGANGYLTTRATAAEIVAGIRRIARGETLVCTSLAMPVMSRIRQLAQERAMHAQRRLTSREETVSNLLAKGRTNREIATVIGLSERTVKHYVSSLIQKFDVRNRTQLVLAMSQEQFRRDAHRT